MEAIIFVGIQGSGKSYFYAQRFFNSHVRISLDVLKTRNREARMMQVCLETQQSFVIDNTNPKVSDRTDYIRMAKEKGFRVAGYFFEPNISESLKRNDARKEKERVPKPAIFATLKRLERPSLTEGFDELFSVDIGQAGEFDVQNWPKSV